MIVKKFKDFKVIIPEEKEIYLFFKSLNYWYNNNKMFYENNIKEQSKFTISPFLSENLFCLSLNLHCKNYCAYRLKSAGDLLLINKLNNSCYKTEIKFISSNGPSSFSPKKTAEYIITMESLDIYNSGIIYIKIFKYKEIENLKLNKKETFIDKQKKENRPRFCFLKENFYKNKKYIEKLSIKELLEINKNFEMQFILHKLKGIF